MNTRARLAGGLVLALVVVGCESPTARTEPHAPPSLDAAADTSSGGGRGPGGVIGVGQAGSGGGSTEPADSVSHPG